MNLLTDAEIKSMSGFKEAAKYNDKYINSVYSNYVFLYENYDNIIRNGISPETVLYSEYYWGALFISAYRKKYGEDAGFEQFHFKLIDRIEYTIGSVDIALLEKIDKLV
ncbi:MAG: hypothetical protein K2J40_04185 [Ruminococcus sp.]|nr:hypothetical protein [Ruminococcus sp.]